MKKLFIAFIGCGLLLGFGVSNALAAKADGPKARLFAKYDKNKNGVIDGEEKDALRKDFAADKEGELKRYDANKDGKLDDKEIAEIKPPGSKKKKAATAATPAKPESGEKSEKAGKTEDAAQSAQPGKKKTDKPGSATP